MLRAALLCLLAASAEGQVCGTAVEIDMNENTNTDAKMEWTNAATPPTTYSDKDPTYGIYIIPFDTTDQTTGALPGGFIRYTKVGTGNGGLVNGGNAFDLLVTVPVTPPSYGSDVEPAYGNPSGFTSQGLLTALGYACHGVSISPSTCASGSGTVNPTTGLCTDATGTIYKRIYAPLPTASRPASRERRSAGAREPCPTRRARPG
eukprot:7391176-Prymnesium_polylepis.1